MAHEVLFQFEQTIELFVKALEYELEHRNTILKNLTKTIAKYVNSEEPFQPFESDESEKSDAYRVHHGQFLIEVWTVLLLR